MKEVPVHEAEARLTELIKRVEAGEEIAIERAGVIIARLVPAPFAGKRPLGMDTGLFTVPDDFDAPLGEETLDSFET